MFKKLPSVLAFTRGIILSDATMFNRFENGTTRPVMVVRHGIAGTQNTGTSTDNASMIQITDSAKLDPQANALQIRFGLGFLDLADTLHSCSAKGKTAREQKEKIAEVKAFVGALSNFIAKAKTSNASFDVACRYARNVANGRWTWRNRTIAKTMSVSILVDGDRTIEFKDSLSVPLHKFGNYSKEELELAELFNANIKGQANHRFDVCATLDFGIRGAIEVYPSQNYVEKKPRGFARPLYYVRTQTPIIDDDLMSFEGIRQMGQAAFRDQKIGNALRTFDTWFADFHDYGKAISVEAAGANLAADTFFRNNKDNAFALAKQFDELDPASAEGQYMIAFLLRGGLLGEGEGKEA